MVSKNPQSRDIEDPRPIGVFDSGLGGLTVLKSMVRHFPWERFLYLGDTARLPYGTKSSETIRRYSEQNVDFLIRQGVKAVVIACNSASSQFQERVWKGCPIFNVIDPGVWQALSVTQTDVVGVLGTRATVQSEAYPFRLRTLRPQVQVYSQACPLFVPLAEEGWAEDPITQEVACRYLSSLVDSNSKLDTLIMGCTHYPILKTSLQRAWEKLSSERSHVEGQILEGHPSRAKKNIQLVDSGEALCDWLKRDFYCGGEEDRGSRASPINQKDQGGSGLSSSPISSRPVIYLMSTDLSSHFVDLAKKILFPFSVERMDLVDLS